MESDLHFREITLEQCREHHAEEKPLEDNSKAWVKDDEDSTKVDTAADREEGIDSFREVVESTGLMPN